MDQNTPIMSSNQPCCCKGCKILAAVALIAAVGGVGLGVYNFMQLQKKDSQITELKQSIDAIKNTASTTDNGTTKPKDTEVVVSDWGFKIKVPESVTVLSYSMLRGSFLSINCALASDETKTASLEITKVDKAAVVNGEAQMESLDEAVYLDDTYAYYLMYQGPAEDRDKTVDLMIMEAFSDTSLYTKI